MDVKGSGWKPGPWVLGPKVDTWQTTGCGRANNAMMAVASMISNC